MRSSFALERVVPALDTVVVAACQPDDALSESEQRRRVGVGQFMTLEQIEKLQFVETATYLLTFQSTQLIGGTLLSRRDCPASGCPYQFFLDGVLVNTPNVIANLPRPAELYGLKCIRALHSIHSSTSRLGMALAA